MSRFSHIGFKVEPTPEGSWSLLTQTVFGLPSSSRPGISLEVWHDVKRLVRRGSDRAMPYRARTRSQRKAETLKFAVADLQAKRRKCWTQLSFRKIDRQIASLRSR